MGAHAGIVVGTAVTQRAVVVTVWRLAGRAVAARAGAVPQLRGLTQRDIRPAQVTGPVITTISTAPTRSSSSLTSRIYPQLQLFRPGHFDVLSVKSVTLNVRFTKTDIKNDGKGMLPISSSQLHDLANYHIKSMYLSLYMVMFLLFS